MQLSDFIDTSVVGPRNIPTIKFVENIGDLVATKNPSQIIHGLNELHSKYKFMEANLNRQQVSLKEKVKDISEALAVVRQFIKLKAERSGEFETYYHLADSIYAKAVVPPVDSVCLWLGANVLMEYPLNEAETLLEKNLASAEEGIESLRRDCTFLRQQITTSEVSIARVHNYNVKQRKTTPHPI